jgi:hypothetical protein
VTPSTTTSARRSATVVAALLATLAIAPVAHAGTTTPPDRADGLGSSHATSHVATVTPPDRTDALGGATIATHTAVLAPPDRVDGLGGSRFTPVVAPTVIVRSAAAGFDWTAAVIGAVAGLGLSLVAMAALFTRGRRDIALPS